MSGQHSKHNKQLLGLRIPGMRNKLFYESSLSKLSVICMNSNLEFIVWSPTSVHPERFSSDPSVIYVVRRKNWSEVEKQSPHQHCAKWSGL